MIARNEASMRGAQQTRVAQQMKGKSNFRGGGSWQGSGVRPYDKATMTMSQSDIGHPVRDNEKNKIPESKLRMRTHVNTLESWDFLEL